MTNDHALQNSGGDMIIYSTEDGCNRIQCRLVNETIWLSQSQMGQLFERSKKTISEHLQNIFQEGELDEGSVVRNFRTTAADGKTYQVAHYKLEAVLAVGFRVKSPRGTQFRRWANTQLQELIVKGFVLDDERLKGGGGLVDYFDELLARIREIRASEARVYQRIREIFSLAADYREGEEETLHFFAFMQNKMHYAATGLTAAEIIKQRADADVPNMGLTAWKGGRVLKRDVGTAKNYLDADEIDTLNRITVMFLDQAEFRAQRRKDIHLADWETFLDKFLVDTELPILDGPGTVSRQSALDWAAVQYENFADRRRIQAEQEADQEYLEDLAKAAQQIASIDKQEDKKNQP